jgi:hypothetical protein
MTILVFLNNRKTQRNFPGLRGHDTQCRYRSRGRIFQCLKVTFHSTNTKVATGYSGAWESRFKAWIQKLWQAYPVLGDHDAQCMNLKYTHNVTEENANGLPREATTPPWQDRHNSDCKGKQAKEIACRKIVRPHHSWGSSASGGTEECTCNGGGIDNSWETKPRPCDEESSKKYIGRWPTFGWRDDHVQPFAEIGSLITTRIRKTRWGQRPQGPGQGWLRNSVVTLF